MMPIISAAQLFDRMRTQDWLLLDCRFDLGDQERAAGDYARGHIPGALYADLNRDLSDLSKISQGRHPLPDAVDFSSVLSRWGWTPQTTVVVYDAACGALAAARAWWMLRAVGARDVAVLDGGLPAWQRAGFALSEDAPEPIPTQVNATYDLTQTVGSNDVQVNLGNAGWCLIDARAANRYRGEVEPIDAVAGHVPGARNRPFSENLQSDGCFKSAKRLRDEFEALLGAHAPADVVHMCGSGVTACHNLLAMEQAGLAGSRLYAPSWSGWIADSARPVATGPDPRGQRGRLPGP